MTGDARSWTASVLLGSGASLIRFSFIGLIGDRRLPVWAERLLAYVPVAVLPALVAPLVVWPAATGGSPDPARLLAAVAALAVGAWRRSVIAAILAGLATLYLALWLVG
jgi:branched-subunit amino acid transport protein